MAERVVEGAERQTAAWARAAVTVGQVAAAVAREAQTERVVAVVLDQTMQLLGAQVATIHLADRERRQLQLVGQRNVPADFVGRMTRFSFDAPLLTARAARTQEIQVVEDTAHLDPELVIAREVFARTGMRSMLAVPLIAFGRLGGVLSFALPQVHHFSSDERAAVRTISEIFAVGLANAQTYEEQQRIAAALRVSEERFRLLAENSLDLVFRYRLVPMRGFEYVSPSVTNILGYTPEELYADPDLGLNLVYPDDRPQLQSLLESPGKLGKQPLLLRLTRKDGPLVWVEVQYVPVYDAASQLVALQGSGRDVTERVRVTDQLVAERSWLRTVIERAPIAILLIEGPDGTRVVANPWAERLFGFPSRPDEGIAQFVGRVCRPDGTPFRHEELASARALRGKVVVNEEQLLRVSDGRTVPIRVSAAPIWDAAGHVRGAVLLFDDVSALKELERLREEWTSIIAHDLRQPVTVISGYANLLARRTEERAVSFQAATEHILASARQLDRMIADLLDVSRIEARRLKLDRQVVNLPVLVQAVVERTAEITKGHLVRVAIKRAVPELMADPVRLEQILSNLLSNAAKYGYSDTPIRVDVEACNREVQVSVTNLGPGIRPQDIPDLFTRFHRARRVQAERKAGLGLGLYIAKGLVEAHGGRIWVESTPGRETTFSFTLPIGTPKAGG